MIPAELLKNTPRDINYSDPLFSKNRKKVKGILIGSLLIIPLVGMISWWKWDDLVSGILWGAGIAALFELMGVAMMLNGMKAVNLCRNGNVTMGIVEKSEIHGNTGAHSITQSAGYIFIHVIYNDRLGQGFDGMVPFIGNKQEIDLKPGEQVPVLYLDEKPETFILYSESLGISAIGKAKKN